MDKKECFREIKVNITGENYLLLIHVKISPEKCMSLFFLISLYAIFRKINLFFLKFFREYINAYFNA